MRKYIVLIGITTLMGACSMLPNKAVPNQDKATSSNQMDHKHSFFVAREAISDGYEFIFHVMPAPEGEGFSRSRYHLMVSIEKDGHIMTDIHPYSSVKHPDGSVQAKTPMMQMGDWYMSLYNLSHGQGRHWLTVSFERSGKTYSSGVYYPERPYHQ